VTVALPGGAVQHLRELPAMGFASPKVSISFWMSLALIAVGGFTLASLVISL
jgi:hypothetical protein